MYFLQEKDVLEQQWPVAMESDMVQLIIKVYYAKFTCLSN